jgi:hypothetical protein
MLFTRLTAKMLLLAVLLIAPAACSLTNDDDNNGGDRPTPIPTSFVMTTPTVLVVTATPAPTTASQPTSAPQPTQVNVPPCTIPAGWVPIGWRRDTLSNIARRVTTVNLPEATALIEQHHSWSGRMCRLRSSTRRCRSRL